MLHVRKDINGKYPDLTYKKGCPKFICAIFFSVKLKKIQEIYFTDVGRAMVSSVSELKDVLLVKCLSCNDSVILLKWAKPESQAKLVIPKMIVGLTFTCGPELCAVIESMRLQLGSELQVTRSVVLTWENQWMWVGADCQGGQRPVPGLHSSAEAE